MSSKFDELKRRAQQAARDLDDRFDVSSKLNEGARAARDAVRKGADAATSGFQSVREEASRLDREHKVTETVAESARRATSAAQDAWRSSGAEEKVADAFNTAGKAAAGAAESARSTTSDLFGNARQYYETATGAARTGVSAARLPSSIAGAVCSARHWIKDNPGKTAIVGLALVAGTRAGSAFSALDVAVLGAGGAGNWLFHSAVVPYGLRKLTDKYETYLKEQERLIAEGQLDDAARQRTEFQRDLAKYVGAPLLGAFSVAAGAGLVYEAFTGAAVTGFPINLILGGNPLLSSIWLFGNGLVCFHNGYRFFMMALADQEDVARVVRDIKGLLPEAAIS